MTLKTFIQLILILCLISCNRTIHVNPADEKLLGTYKRGSDNFREVLNLEDKYVFTSEFSSRIFGDEVFKENGKWRVVNDTLLIDRTRHDVLKKADFPTSQKFIFRDEKLFELRVNYKGELFEDTSYFERK